LIQDHSDHPWSKWCWILDPSDSDPNTICFNWSWKLFRAAADDVEKFSPDRKALLVCFKVWQRVFPLWTLAGGKRALRGLTGRTTALDSGSSSEQHACCGRGTCHGLQSTVGSATTEIRTLRELGLHSFILRTSLYVYHCLRCTTLWCKIVNLGDVKS